MNKVLESAHESTVAESRLWSPGVGGAGRHHGGRGAGTFGDGGDQHHLDCEDGFSGVDVSKVTKLHTSNVTV